MGGCASKPKNVEYDSQMQHKQVDHTSPPEVKLEDDVFLRKHSRSRRSLSILFKEEEDEERELFTKQEIQNKDIVQQPKTLKSLANAVSLEKQDNLMQCEIESVCIVDQVKVNASQVCAQEVVEIAVNPGTSVEGSDVLCTNKSPEVGTGHLKVNDEDSSLSTGTLGCQLHSILHSSVDLVDDVTGVEDSMIGHGNENQVSTVELGNNTETGDAGSSSLRNDGIDGNTKSTFKSGTKVPMADVKNTPDDVKGKNVGTKILTNGNDVTADNENSPKSGIKETIVEGTHSSSAIEDKSLCSTLSASSKHAPDAYVDNILKSGTRVQAVGGNCTSNDKKNEYLSATIPTNENCDLENGVENFLKSRLVTKLTGGNYDVDDNVQNSLKPEIKVPIIDGHSDFNDVKVKGLNANIADDGDNGLDDHTENPLNSGIKVPMIDLEHSSDNIQAKDSCAMIPINGSRQEASKSTEIISLIPVEDHRNDSLHVNMEEKSLESEKAAESDCRNSVIATITNVSSDMVPCVLLERKLEGRLMTEPLGTFSCIGEGEIGTESKEYEFVVGLIEEQVARETRDVYKNAGQDNGSFVNNIDYSSKVHQEELSQSNRSAAEESCGASASSFGNEFVKDDKLHIVERVEGAPDNTVFAGVVWESNYMEVDCGTLDTSFETSKNQGFSALTLEESKSCLPQIVWTLLCLITSVFNSFEELAEITGLDVINKEGMLQLVDKAVTTYIPFQNNHFTLQKLRKNRSISSNPSPETEVFQQVARYRWLIEHTVSHISEIKLKVGTLVLGGTDSCEDATDTSKIGEKPYVNLLDNNDDRSPVSNCRKKISGRADRAVD
eukprot:Gb_06682 [translate_table: standard]